MKTANAIAEASVTLCICGLLQRTSYHLCAMAKSSSADYIHPRQVGEAVGSQASANVAALVQNEEVAMMVKTAGQGSSGACPIRVSAHRL
jgi:hypothetical protein